MAGILLSKPSQLSFGMVDLRKSDDEQTFFVGYSLPCEDLQRKVRVKCDGHKC